MEAHLNDQQIQRRESLNELRALGIDPFPAATFPVSHTAKEILDAYSEKPEDFQNVCIAGRLMTRRIMGKAAFAVIQDSTTRLQVYIARDEICPEEDKTWYNTIFKKLLDIGDFIGVEGYMFTTKTGETTLHATKLTFLAKCLNPLPLPKEKDGEIYDAFTDPELRARMRYVDLVVNPQHKETFIKRSKIVQSLRNTFNDRGYIEVETPILQAIHGGAAARPFSTHHNALDIPLYLRIANELYLKRLIVGGFDGVYEFAKNFRNEGIDRTHNPEFTALEIYVAYKDYFWMMDFVEEMLEKCAMDVNGTTDAQMGERTINFARPYQRMTMAESIKKYGNFDIEGKTEQELGDYAKGMGCEVTNKMGVAKLIDEIFGEVAEPHLIQPTFITDYPIEMSPLTKKHRSKPGLVERFELFVNGKEIANAYSELNDPEDQRERFLDQLKLAERGDDEAMAMDQDFLRALEYGMPPTSGLGVGIDRLTMMLTNNASIQEVLFFPQMRPEKTFNG